MSENIPDEKMIDDIVKMNSRAAAHTMGLAIDLYERLRESGKSYQEARQEVLETAYHDIYE